MQVQEVRNDNINFGHKIRPKNTYRALKGHYEVLNDKSSAVECGILDHEARARLHYMKHQKVQKALIDKADEGYSGSKIGFLTELIKLRMKSVYEKIASAYYYYF